MCVKVLFPFQDIRTQAKIVLVKKSQTLSLTYGLNQIVLEQNLKTVTGHGFTLVLKVSYTHKVCCCDFH